MKGSAEEIKPIKKASTRLAFLGYFRLLLESQDEINQYIDVSI